MFRWNMWLSNIRVNINKIWSERTLGYIGYIRYIRRLGHITIGYIRIGITGTY